MFYIEIEPFLIHCVIVQENFLLKRLDLKSTSSPLL
jgi:hypothetical protein